MRKALARAVVGWRVMATVTDDKGTGLRPVSRTFAARSAADAFADLARPTYPDAYIQSVEKTDRVQAGVLVSDRI